MTDKSSSDGKNGRLGVPSLDDGKTTLYSSKGTAPRIDGMREELATLTKADTLFITVEDYKARPGAMDEGRNLKSLLQGAIPKDVYGKLFSNLTRKEWSDFAQTLQQPVAQGFDLNGDRRNDFGVISLGSRTETKEGLIRGLTHAKPGTVIKNIPGTDEQHQDFTTRHEARHIGQPNVGGPDLAYEIDADRAALAGRDRNGQPVSPEMQRAIGDARAVGALGGNGSLMDIMDCTMKTLRQNCGLPTHATHPGLSKDLQDGLPVLTEAKGQEWVGMLKTKMVVNGMLGTLSFQEELKGLNANTTLSEPEKYMRAAGVVGDMRNLVKVGERGAIVGSENIVAGKAALDSIRHKNFMQDPGVQKYAERVDKFFEAHMPDYKTQPEYEATRSGLKDMAKVFDTASAAPAVSASAPVPSMPFKGPGT